MTTQILPRLPPPPHHHRCCTSAAGHRQRRPPLLRDGGSGSAPPATAVAVAKVQARRLRATTAATGWRGFAATQWRR